MHSNLRGETSASPEGKISEVPKTMKYQKQIFSIWDQYRKKKISPRMLLSQISRHYHAAEITEPTEEPVEEPVDED